MPVQVMAFGVHAASVQERHFELLGLKPHGSAQCASAQSRSADQQAAHATEKGTRLRTQLAVQSPPDSAHDSKQL